MDGTSNGGETTTCGSSSPAKGCSKNRGRCETISTIDGSASLYDLQNATTAQQPEDVQDIPRWFPRCCGRPILHGKPEALGFLLGMIGQIIGILGIGTFMVPALLYFAKLEAGCEVEVPEGETVVPECNETVYGLKPSSMITTLATIVSLIVTFLTPLMGAMVDYTNHRRRIGRWVAFFLWCSVLPHLFISEATWFPLTVCLLIMATSVRGHALVLHAYLPDLTDSEEKLNDFTKVFTAGSGGSVLVFIIIVIGLSLAFGVGGEEGPTARIASIVGVPVIASCFLVTWGFLLKERPALNVLEEGQSILTSGFKQIYRTSGKLYRTNVALLWFYAAVALGDVKSFTGIALTFLSSQQQFNSMDLGIAAITMLVSTIPGAALSSFLCRRFNPIRSSIMALVCFVIVTSCASVFLTGPNQNLPTYVFVAGWGIVGAWKLTSTLLLVAAIVPEGQDAELMGFYIFADASLSWLPPLIFTGLNELGVSERVGLSIINIFFLLAIVAYCKIGSYDDSVKKANRLSVPTSDPMVSIEEDEDISLSKTNNVVNEAKDESITPQP